jgi:tetratricopeptide (TPR) repeat protein
MRSFFFLLLTGIACTCVRAQKHETLALQAYLGNDLPTWEAAIAATTSIADPEERLLTVAEFQLGRGYAAMAADDKAALNDALDEAGDALDALWEINDGNAVAHGVYAGLLGLKIAKTPITGMLYGSRASKYAEKAAKLGSDNGAALYHAASNLHYTPEQWGGDPESALALLERAVDAYGPDRDRNWRYLNTLALKGQVQARLGRTDAARATYARALDAQPDFLYVSRVLLPQLEQ